MIHSYWNSPSIRVLSWKLLLLLMNNKGKSTNHLLLFAFNFIITTDELLAFLLITKFTIKGYCIHFNFLNILYTEGPIKRPSRSSKYWFQVHSKLSYYVRRVPTVGLSGRQPSTQKFGRSSMLFQRLSSLPVESIQSTGLPKCLPGITTKIIISSSNAPVIFEL